LAIGFTPTEAGSFSGSLALTDNNLNSFAPANVQNIALSGTGSGMPTITWNAPEPITYGTPLSATQLDATSTAAGSFTYSPAAGTVLGTGEQNLTVTFTPTDSADFTEATATVTLTVNQATPAITWATPAPITYGTPLSGAQLNAISTEAGTFTYSPAAGTVFGAGDQTLTVTFTPTDATNYTTATATVMLTVNQATPTISWAAPAAITYGTPLSRRQLNALSTVAGTFTYSPAAGTVLGAGQQTLTVTFTPTDTTDYTTATATVTLTVNQATPMILWATPAAITYGTPLSGAQLNARSPVAGSFDYSPAAGSVLDAGIQTLTATFTPTDSTDYSTATATVKLTVNKTALKISWAAPVPISYGTSLSSAQLDATSSASGAFVYSPAEGTVLPVGSHTLSVTLTPSNPANYTTATATATVTLKVNKATPAISWASPAAITYGTPLSATQLNATSTVAGTFAYSPAAGTELNTGQQTLKVTFTPSNAANYTTATASVMLTVNKATPTINWATPKAITYGTALSVTQLNATSTVAGSFAYSPAAGTVLNAGQQTLKVTFTPSNATNYTNATASVTLAVNKATPAIIWETPKAIIYGTALSATQLNATSTVAGTFTYSPAVGTVLGVGSHTLTATFTPTNATNYTTSTATVTLTVHR
jgi:phage-related protein